MTRSRVRIKTALFATLTCGWIFQAACIHQLQNEIEVLYAPTANGLAFPSSLLVQWFGVQFIKAFNTTI